MANILRKIGDEFASSDTNGYRAFVLWLSIFFLVGVSLFIGARYTNSLFIIVCLMLAGILIIPHIYYLIRWLFNKANELVSARWDKMGKDDE
ncbi:MAG: hypothetical protein KBC33_03065 [Candidatus Pacebacteria bacterium]|nr:hypothetical protein [Candidatus Paceibacterota bacterium]